MSCEAPATAMPEIREANLGDILQITGFLQSQLRNIYPKINELILVDEFDSPESYDRTHGKILEKFEDPRSSIHIAVLGERIVGCASQTTAPNHVSATFNNFYVDSEMQGAGTGHNLFRAIGDDAKENGVAKVKLLVLEGLVKSIKFYEKNGFVEAHRFTQLSPNVDNPQTPLSYVSMQRGMRDYHMRHPVRRPTSTGNEGRNTIPGTLISDQKWAAIARQRHQDHSEATDKSQKT